jgi:DNA-binding response OmpR family regulator
LFSLWFPREHGGTGAPAFGRCAVASTTTPRVLIVDEDAQARAQLARLLADAGYDVLEASSGAEAIGIAREQDLSLALVEVVLADLSGYEVCRTIRDELGQDPRIIFLSGDRTESYDRVAGLLIGADDYVAKPYAPDELLARVRTLLRRERAAPAAARGLTAREREVLTLLAEGLTPAETRRRTGASGSQPDQRRTTESVPLEYAADEPSLSVECGRDAERSSPSAARLRYLFFARADLFRALLGEPPALVLRRVPKRPPAT